jgi:hypothetical protein
MGSGFGVPGLVCSTGARAPLWSYNQNLWMHHLTEDTTYLPL